MKKVLLLTVFATQVVFAEPIVHGFKNPSFSGIGAGAHYLTVENQEHGRTGASE